jgi:hypothetical protein
MRDKQFILSEIQRTAAQNGGKPLGQAAFLAQTGIARHEWKGVYWVRWPDALKEAGFVPLEGTAAFSLEEMLDGLAKLIRYYGRYPIDAEIRSTGRGNKAFPSTRTLRKKLGYKSEIIQKLRAYCSQREEYADVSIILAQETTGATPESNDDEGKIRAGKIKPSGYVYLVKSGKLHKIGLSIENPFRRKSELHKQTSEGIIDIHTISAIDDAPGIEKYWHERFKEKRQHGEWFDLSAEDISAFKKRKFM